MTAKQRKYFSILGCPLLLALFMNAAQGQEIGTNASSARSAKDADAPGMAITYAEGKLSADLQNAEIKEILTKIGSELKADIRIGDGISGKVTTSFQNLGLEEGLAKLLVGEGTGIVVGYDQKGMVKLIQISKTPGTQPATVIKVRKVRNYFSPTDVASSMDLEDVKELAGVLGNPKKKDRWVRAAKQIINIKRPEAKPYLKEMIHHEDDFVRNEAMNEYAMLVDVEDADFILEMAKDKSWETRGAAAYIAMTLVADPRQIPVLIDMLKDEMGSVRDAAIRALGFKRSQDAVPYLKELLKHEDGGTRAESSDALFLITKTRYDWMTPEERKHQDENWRHDEEVLRKARENDKAREQGNR